MTARYCDPQLIRSPPSYYTRARIRVSTRYLLSFAVSSIKSRWAVAAAVAAVEHFKACRVWRTRAAPPLGLRLAVSLVPASANNGDICSTLKKMLVARCARMLAVPKVRPSVRGSVCYDVTSIDNLIFPSILSLSLLFSFRHIHNISLFSLSLELNRARKCSIIGITARLSSRRRTRTLLKLK